MNPFDTPSQPKEKITGKHIAAVVVFALLLMAPVAWLVFQQRQAETAKIEAARVAKAERESAEKAIKSVAVNLPQDPRPAKIAKGTSGKAKLVSVEQLPFNDGNYPNTDVICVGPLPENYGEAWGVYTTDGACSASSKSPGDWGVAEDGSVRVPAKVAPNKYRLTYNVEGGGNLNEFGEYVKSSKSITYEFEVKDSKIARSENHTK